MAELAYSTKLSIQRTVMAADRTLMAWIRTSLSMISFGFTIYKVIQGLQEAGDVAIHGLDGRVAGLILSGLGAISIFIGMVEYFIIIKDIRSHYPISHWRYSLAIGVGIFCIGVTIFISIWVRVA